MAKEQPFVVVCGLRIIVKKDFYDGLWNLVYEDGGRKWAGPYKTKREALERLADARED